MQKDFGPKNLYEFFSAVANTLGGWWISGIVLTIIFALIFKFWTNTNLVPALFLLGVAIRIPEQQFLVHRMFETITLSAIIIALHFNPLVASIFAIAAFGISRFFGPVENPAISINLGIVTAIIAYLAPFMAPKYTFLMLAVYLNITRIFIFTTINFVIVKNIKIYITQTVWALIVGVGFNYALVLFLMRMGWV